MPYYRRSLEVKAIRLTGENLPEVIKLIGNDAEIRPNHAKDDLIKLAFVSITQKIHTIVAYVGDWIVIDSDGIIRVYEDSEFDKFFTSVPNRKEKATMKKKGPFAGLCL